VRGRRLQAQRAGPPPQSISVTPLRHLAPNKRVLGRQELVDFPAFGLLQVEAKIDTGAFTCALHCTHQRVETAADGTSVLRVRLFDERHPQHDGQPLEFRQWEEREIRNSFGDVQRRYVIRAAVVLFGQAIETEFSLSDRSDLRFPVLLGRALLQQGSFVVDVTRRNVSYKYTQRQRKRK
jgi:hypothetical protein